MDKFICVPITETSAGAFLNAIAEAAPLADLVELRLDYLPDNDRAAMLERLPELAAKTKLLLTFRPREQGGQRDLSPRDRQNFWLSLPREVAEAISFADLEFDLIEYLQAEPPVPWKKVICSWHNFKQTPESLLEQFYWMESAHAATIKIATMANQIGDCLPLFELFEQPGHSKQVVVLGMGLPGIATRVLSLSRGALLTFGSLRRGAESAAGQPTVAELRDLYRVNQLTRESEIYGVIGNPAGHSRSPLMHNAALAATGRDGVYLPFQVDDAASFVRDFLHPRTKKMDWNLRGVSVTIPHKLAVMPHLDWIDDTAKAIGAVNTIVVRGNELHGYNTDVVGAMKPLDRLIDLRDAPVAVIGAGGSARAVCYGLSVRGADVTIYARDASKAQPLADEFKIKVAPLASFNGQEDVIINCSPVGMHGHSEGQSLIKAESLQGVKLVYDLIYTPEETALLRDAKAAGCQTLGGLAMLVGQAVEQFRLWTGLEAPADVMWRALR